jgi:GAF domain-containing protein
MTDHESTEAKKELERVALRLLEATQSSRVVLRLSLNGTDQEFDIPFLEILSTGVSSLGSYRPSYRGEPAPRAHLKRTRRVLVQDDVIGADPPPPPALVEIHRVRAQMMGPIFHHDLLIGVLSVQQVDTSRSWSSDHVTALENAAAKVLRILVEFKLVTK